MAKCMMCRKRDATFHLFDVDMKFKHYCDTCAAKKKLDSFLEPYKASKKEGKVGTTRVSDNKSNIIIHMGGKIIPVDLDSIKCERCGITLRDMLAFTKTACPMCHDSMSMRLKKYLQDKLSQDSDNAPVPLESEPLTFQSLLKPKASNSSEVASKANEPLTIEALQAKLKKAIKLEQYEDAARLRDQIEEIKKSKGEQDASANSGGSK